MRRAVKNKFQSIQVGFSFLCIDMAWLFVKRDCSVYLNGAQICPDKKVQDTEKTESGKRN